MDKLYSIGKAAKYLGVSVSTLRRWENSGKLIPERTKGQQRRYPISLLSPNVTKLSSKDCLTIAYARVSSHDQKSDLERQKQLLEMYCASKGWVFEIVADLGSGMNYNKKGLKRLINSILIGEVGRLAWILHEGGIYKNKMAISLISGHGYVNFHLNYV